MFPLYFGMPNYLKVPVLAVLIACTTSPKTDLLDKGIPLSMAEFRKQQVADVNYQLSFDIPELLEDPVQSELQLSLAIRDLSQPLFLDFNEEWERVQSIAVNEVPIAIDHQLEHLIIDPKYLVQGANQVFIKFLAGELSLNRNEDFLYTLLVPDRASTLFPCFDQPDLKATYDLTITTPLNWSVMCGAPLLSVDTIQQKRVHRFERTPLMSTYLFSLVAGDFQRAQQSGMEIFYRETDQSKITESLDVLFGLHEESVDFMEEYTAYEFPFPKLDFATIPGFQYGGMEHVGAIQYRESVLFLDATATNRQLLRRGKLIAHETAHMWFGDLVTMRWFDDVWLKEVFANFMADKIINPTFPLINHDLQFLVSHYPSAYSEDRTLGTNPIRQNLPNLKDAGSLYGRIIYNKAPIMMRQLEAILGETKFREGMQSYIETYANANAEWDDLIAILDEKTDQDLRKWSEVWVNQAGRPVISANIEYESDNIFSFELRQVAEDGSDKVWPQGFDIGLVYEDRVEQLEVSMVDRKMQLTEAIGKARPNQIIYNYNGFGYGVFPLPEQDLSKLTLLEEEVAKGHAYLNLFENTLMGNIDANSAFSFFLKALETEDNELIAQLLSNQIQTLFWKYFSEVQRSEGLTTLFPVVEGVLNGQSASNIKKIAYHLLANTGYQHESLQLLYAIWSGERNIEGLKLNQQDKSSLALQLALYDHPKANAITAAAEDQINNDYRKQRFQFLKHAVSEFPEIRQQVFEDFKKAENRETESWVTAANNYIHHPLRQAESIQYLPTALDLLEEIQLTGDIFFPKGWLASTVGNYTSAEAMAMVDDYLTQNPNLKPNLKSKLLMVVDDMYRVQGRR